jgi:tetratricopeptide (TPR) repeat protein
LLSFRGSIFFTQTNYDPAIADYTKAIQLNPKFTGQYSYRGDAYAQNGDYDAAIADYTEVINNNSDKAIKAMTYGKRGFLYSRKGDYRMGIADCNKAIKIDANCGLAYNNLAWFLAVSPDAALRNGRKALEYARKACVLSAWKEPHCLGTLAAAYAEAGNFEKAVKCQKRCMTLGLPAGEQEQAQKDLGLYEQNKPYHEDGQK